jgi:hypothetical protein
MTAVLSCTKNRNIHRGRHTDSSSIRLCDEIQGPLALSLSLFRSFLEGTRIVRADEMVKKDRRTLDTKWE